jgi:hypothetical protein
LYVRDNLVKQISFTIPPTSDLYEKSLSAYASLMLAQAIECYYEKTIEERATSALISKIAAQTSDLYAVCVRNLKSDLSCVSNRCPKVIY